MEKLCDPNLELAPQGNRLDSCSLHSGRKSRGLTSQKKRASVLCFLEAPMTVDRNLM